MRTSKWFYVLAGITLVTGGWSLAGTILGDALFDAGTAALVLYILAGVAGIVLTPFFFVALYFDAGVVQQSSSSWTPDRRLWVGGGVLCSLFAYTLIYNPAIEIIGIAYLLRRLRNPAYREPDDDIRARQSHDSESPGERSITGILVHPFALFTGIIGASLVYVVSEHEFTRANARNALNWHLSALVLTVVAFLTFLLGADERTVAGETVEWSLLPPPLDTVVGLVGLLLLLLAMFSWMLTGIFALIATVKAIFGTPWKYPLARDFLERYT